MLRNIFIILSLFVFAVVKAPTCFAQEIDLQSPESLEAKVIEVIDSGKVEVNDESYPYQFLKLEITKGSLTGKEIEVKNGGVMGMMQVETYKEGDKLRISHAQDLEGNDIFNIAGHIKRDALLLLFILFVISVLLVGRVWGALSIVGMGFSFLVIFGLILPQIMNGTHPVLIAVLGSLLIIPATFYISHGFNKKTHVAVVSTFVALIVTGLLASFFVEAAHLTGFASDEAGFLQVQRQGSIDIRGILLAGIIIGTLGVLDDVTVGQASTVEQLKKANPKATIKDLYTQGMNVGQDHISSMVNTLVLVYAGASLPLLLLFMDGSRSFVEAIDYELIAEEIVRMLVGSIGLVLVAPLATFLAAIVFAAEDPVSIKVEKSSHKH